MECLATDRQARPPLEAFRQRLCHSLGISLSKLLDEISQKPHHPEKAAQATTPGIGPVINFYGDIDASSFTYIKCSYKDLWYVTTQLAQSKAAHNEADECRQHLTAVQGGLEKAGHKEAASFAAGLCKGIQYATSRGLPLDDFQPGFYELLGRIQAL